MLIRALQFDAGEYAVEVEPTHALPESDWVWIDIAAGPNDHDELADLAEQIGLDALSVRDAVEDVDLPKVDDFGTFLLVVLHVLGEERIETYELDCFLSERRLVTIHDQRSPSVEALWDGVRCRPELASGGADETLARLADVATRRLVCVLDVFDDRNEELIQLALRADADFLREITAVRADLAALRRAVHPQREALDILRHSTSPLVSDPAAAGSPTCSTPHRGRPRASTAPGPPSPRPSMPTGAPRPARRPRSPRSSPCTRP